MMTTAAKRLNRLGGVGAAGFTLLEMMVVIGLIAVLASMALPSVIALFNAGADAQAYNLISAQITAARAQAMTNNTYAGIHHQLADVLYSDVYGSSTQAGQLLRPDLAGVGYSAQIVYNSEQKYFDLLKGVAPKRIPGTVVLGYASEKVNAPAGASLAGSLDATIGTSADAPFTGSGSGVTATGVANLSKFTTFSIVFNQLGAVTRFVNSQPIRFNPGSPVFADTVDVAYGTRRLWRMTNPGDPINNYVQDRYGVTAITMFDISQYESAGVSGSPYSDKADYLNKEARLLPLNVHTGQLYERK